MKPSIERNIALDKDTQLGIFAESLGLLPITFKQFLTIERHTPLKTISAEQWDTGAHVSVTSTYPEHMDIAPNKFFIGSELFLLPRYSDDNWDGSEINVHVFMIRIPDHFLSSAKTSDIWLSYCDWLDGHGMLLNLSQSLSLFAQSLIDKNLP